MKRPDIEVILARCDAAALGPEEVWIQRTDFINIARTDLPKLAAYCLELEARVKDLENELRVSEGTHE